LQAHDDALARLAQQAAELSAEYAVLGIRYSELLLGAAVGVRAATTKLPHGAFTNPPDFSGYW
jgi:hypothetical protein